MTHTASLENCKRLYELSGWEGVQGTGEFDERYSLGDLLRKLPAKIDGPINYWLMLHAQRNGQWLAFYDGTTHLQRADTPEDATALLAIALFEQGVLTK